MIAESFTQVNQLLCLRLTTHKCDPDLDKGNIAFEIPDLDGKSEQDVIMALGLPSHSNEDKSNWRPGENATLWSLPSVTSLIVHGVRSISLCVLYLIRFKCHGKTMTDPLLDFLDNCPLLEIVDVSYASESSCSRNQLDSLPTSALTHNKYTTGFTTSGCSTCFLPPPPVW